MKIQIYQIFINYFVNPAYNFPVHKLPNKGSQLFMTKQILSALSILIFTAFTVNAQDVPLEQFLDKAYGATVKYRETFKNLVAEELRTTDYFNKDETLDDSRKIKSIFIVYQSEKDSSSVYEYRNVTEYNGKNVTRDDDDVVKFFEKLANSDSSKKEAERLREDGVRFDGRFRAFGMALGQGNPLQPFYREFFEFKVVGKEKFEGREALVVEYKQTKPTFRITVNATREEDKKETDGIKYDGEISGSFRPTNPRVQGKFWLDAETGQIWRDEYSVTIHPATLSKPVVSANFLNEYQSSEFGILVPKKLRLESYRLKGKNDKTLAKSKKTTITCEYSKFSNANSEIKDAKTTK